MLTAKDKVFQGCVKHVAELKERGMLHTQLLTAVWRGQKFAKYHQQLVGLLQVIASQKESQHVRRWICYWLGATTSRAYKRPGLVH